MKDIVPLETPLIVHRTKEEFVQKDCIDQYLMLSNLFPEDSMLDTRRTKQRIRL